MWFKFGSGLAQVWVRFGSDLVQVWLGAVQMRFRFGSDLVQVWFRGGSGWVRFGSTVVQIWFRFGSEVVHILFRSGSGWFRLGSHLNKHIRHQSERGPGVGPLVSGEPHRVATLSPRRLVVSIGSIIKWPRTTPCSPSSGASELPSQCSCCRRCGGAPLTLHSRRGMTSGGVASGSRSRTSRQLAKRTRRRTRRRRTGTGSRM